LVARCDDGSYLALLFDPNIRGTAHDQLLAAARAGEDVDERTAGGHHPATIEVVHKHAIVAGMTLIYADYAVCQCCAGRTS
jgi:hypothetical protein